MIVNAENENGLAELKLRKIAAALQSVDHIDPEPK